jgi:hypothetical protein
VISCWTRLRSMSRGLVKSSERWIPEFNTTQSIPGKVLTMLSPPSVFENSDCCGEGEPSGWAAYLLHQLAISPSSVISN